MKTLITKYVQFRIYIIGNIVLFSAILLIAICDSRRTSIDYCEGVYMEHDSSYVFYYDENVSQFVIEAKPNK
jgi:hypothetical protein